MKTYAFISPNSNQKLEDLVVEIKSVIGNDQQAIDKKRDLMIELFRKSNGRG